MNEIRKRKMESAILRALSELIARTRIKDDRLGLVSVTQVEIAPDLSKMTVFVSPFGSDEENEETWTALKQNAAAFQSSVGRALRLRQTPALMFQIDDRIKEGDHILDLLDRQAGNSPSSPETEQ